MRTGRWQAGILYNAATPLKKGNFQTINRVAILYNPAGAGLRRSKMEIPKQFKN
jgi:hypothetical protein